MPFRVRRTPLTALLVAVLLVPTLAACQPAQTAAPTTAPAPATAVKPAASPTAAAVAASPAATKPAAPSPAASPATKPASSPPASPAASPAAQQYPKPTPMSPTGNELGSAGNPIKMAFVPSQDSQKVLASGEPIGAALKEITGLTFQVSVPTSFSAVIEAMGASQVDVGWLNPFGYVLARDKYGVNVILATVRQGSKSYRAQIIVRADSGITSIDQLRGKKFAFADPVSSSGFLYPTALFLSKGYDPKTFFSEVVFAGGHDKVVIAVYNKQVDGGSTFGDSVDGGPPTDARTLVQRTLPDVLQQVKPIATTERIPNDTVSVRKDLPAPLTKLITDGLLYLQTTPEGQKYLKDLYNINGLAPADNADYDSLRSAARAANINLEEQIAPKPKP